jgi:hypothetical protein
MVVVAAEYMMAAVTIWWITYTLRYNIGELTWWITYAGAIYL